MTLQLHKPLGCIQRRSDIGRPSLHRDAGEPDGVKGRLQLDRRRMRDGKALQRDARARQTVAGVQAQRFGGVEFAPLNQAGQRAVEQALAILAHADLPLQHAFA